jgi:hypothetical protein
MDKRILENEFLRIEYLTTSLRIVGLLPAGRPNMLADLSDFPPIPTPFGDFYFHGGHRLWHAPEVMPRSYIPDIGEIVINDLPDGVMCEAQTEPGTGIRKRIEIRLAANKPSAILTHTLLNDGMWPIKLSPWPITQFRLGGMVILPMPVGNVDTTGLLHNRQFSFWPYARINDSRLILDDRFVFFKADAILPPFKMGYFNSHGWIAYWLDGVLFRKSFDVRKGVSYPDNNCNAEIYCGDQFVELESLAPLNLLNPGESVHHVEMWDVLNGYDSMPEEVRLVLARS